MSPTTDNVDANLQGRVIWLEQQSRGLNARICALEMRVSSSGCTGLHGDPASSRTIVPEVEFVPASVSADIAEERRAAGLSERRRSIVEPGFSPVRPEIVRHLPQIPGLEATGLIAGVAMIAVGLLLYAGSFDLLKNPLLAIGCGFALIAGSAVRMVL